MTADRHMLEGYTARQIAAALDAYRELCEVINAGGSAAQFWRYALYDLHLEPVPVPRSSPYAREPSYWRLVILRADLDRGIDSLPVFLRRVAHLYWRRGWRQDAIAKHLRMGRSTVKARLAEARRLVIGKIVSPHEAKCRS